MSAIPAKAIELAVDADVGGSHVMFVNDSCNWLGIESEKLLEVFFPDVSGRKKQLCGAESLVSIEKARQVIGFEPQHHLSATNCRDGDDVRDDAAVPNPPVTTGLESFQ